MVIVGGGAAGVTAGIYSVSYGMRTVVFERMMTGGQVINTEKIDNMLGLPQGISGPDFGMLLQDHLTRREVEIKLTEVEQLTWDAPYWVANTYDGSFTSKAVILAGGSTLKRLNVPGEDDFHGAGVSYCATCDGAFFDGQVVGVVGGGDSALDETDVLAGFASQVLVFHRGNSFSAQKQLSNRVLSNPKVNVYWNSVVEKVLGDTQVEGVNIKDTANGKVRRVDLAGLFIYIGLKPNTEYLQGVVDLDSIGHVSTDIWMNTNRSGLFAAGDIRQNSASQLVSAAGDGATAAIAAQRYVKSRNWV